MAIDTRVFPTSSRVASYSEANPQPTSSNFSDNTYYTQSGSSPNYIYTQALSWEDGQTYYIMSADLGTNLVTEYNIASITNRLSNEDSYVIIAGGSPTPDGVLFPLNSEGEGNLEFVIYGYYFILNSFKPNSNSWDTEYVNLIKSDNEIKAQICISQDSFKSYNYLVQVNDTGWIMSKELTILKR